MKRIIASIVVSSSLFISSGSFAQGIPVIDAAGLANAVQMFTQLQNQYKQMQAQFNQFNGARGMGALLGNPQLRQYLPPEWKTVYNQVSNGGYEGISGSVKAIKDASKILNAQEMARMTTGAQGVLEQQRTQNAIGKGFAEEAYKRAGERIDYLQTLITKIDDTSDPKDVMDLQAAIQAEQAMLQNENIKLQLVAQLQAVEQRILEQQSRERFMRTSGSNSARIK